MNISQIRIHLLNALLGTALFTAGAVTADDFIDIDKTIADAEEKAAEVLAGNAEEIEANFPYDFNAVSHMIVTIECQNSQGDRSAGSGFIGKMDGKTYIFTNQHVIMGADKIEIMTTTGDSMRPVRIELATRRDIARLELHPEDTHEGFEITPTPIIGIPTAVFGNSEGGGVATALYGTVKNVSSDLVEVTAEFVSGNSGSPVLNEKQEVLGIASYVRFTSTEDSDDDDSGGDDDEDGPKKKARRFCYRLTGLNWMPVNWSKYNGEYGKVYRETEDLVDGIFDVVYGWSDDPFGYVPDEHSDYDLRKWAKDHNHMVDKINRLREKGSCTQKELDNINKQISKDIGDSAEALAVFCNRKSRQVSMKLTKRDLTGFLREEFEGYSESLEWASGAINRYGKELSDIKFFHFN